MVTRQYCRELAAAMKRSGLKVLEPEEMFRNLRSLEEYSVVTDAGIHKALGTLDIPSIQTVSQHTRRLARNNSI